MEPWQIAILIKPIAVFIVLVCIVAPIEWAILKALPEGKIKALLSKKNPAPVETAAPEEVPAE